MTKGLLSWYIFVPRASSYSELYLITSFRTSIDYNFIKFIIMRSNDSNDNYWTMKFLVCLQQNKSCSASTKIDTRAIWYFLSSKFNFCGKSEKLKINTLTLYVFDIILLSDLGTSAPTISWWRRVFGAGSKYYSQSFIQHWYAGTYWTRIQRKQVS